MNIIQENIDELNAKVKINISPEDYEEKVETVLKEHRKKMALQGFRPGKVPFGLVKKMYGKAVLVEELNKMLSENLNKHIQEKELPLLGNPLPDENKKVDLDKDKTFEFVYDLALAPQFEVNISNKDKFNYYSIKVDDELIDKYTKDFQRRYGKSEEVDVAGAEDMLYGSFTELNKDGSKKEGGIHHHATISIDYLESKDIKKQLTGAKKGDTIILDPKKVSKGDDDLAAMLGIPVSQADGVGDKFSFKIDSIHRIEPHPLNPELYHQILGTTFIETEEEFRKKLAEDLGTYLKNDADKKLKRDITDKLLDKLKLELPDEFLKRWLLEMAETEDGKKKVNQEDIDRDYPDYSRYLKVQLIEGQIAKENDIKVEFPEVEARVRQNVEGQFKSFGQQEASEELIGHFTKQLMQNEEQVRKIYDQLFAEKLMDFYKKTVKLTEKEVTFDEFVKLASNKPGKGGLLDNISNMLKIK